jgi:hypothetical protein
VLSESEGGVIEMDGTVIAALITGPLSFAGGIVAIVITQRGSKERDHEADWRKLKLEQYKEFIAAFSKVAREVSDPIDQQRYTDAVASLLLVAPPSVLIALKDFQDGIHSKDSMNNKDKWGLWNSFMRVMRKDCHPKDPKDSLEFPFEAVVGLKQMSQEARAKQ